MLCNFYMQNCSNEELPNYILNQKKLYTNINKNTLSLKEEVISDIKDILKKQCGKYQFKVDNYDFHFFFHSTNLQGDAKNKKLYVLFFSARSFETKNGIEKFRDLPFYPRWSYSQFLDGDVLCIEDPMYYKYHDLHIGWMFGDEQYNLLDTCTALLDKLIFNNYDKRNVYLIGSSCGGYGAVQIGSKLNGCNVVTVNPQLYIHNYKYYFKKFIKKIGLNENILQNDQYQRFSTEKLMISSSTRFVIAVNLISDEDYKDQLLELNKYLRLKLNYGVNEFKNIKIWLYLAEASNPHSTMEDNNLIYPLLNLCNSQIDNNLYILFSDIWAKNYELKRKYELNTSTSKSNSSSKNNIKIQLAPKHYETEIRTIKGADKNCFLVVCSHKDNFAFYKYDFGFNTLFITDKKNTYFTLYAGRLTDYIKSIVLTHGIGKVCFLGCSKGGFASILLAGLLSKYLPDIEVKFVSFSPQTCLFPYNDNLYFPSYMNLINLAARDPDISTCLKQYGDLTRVIGQKNLKGDIYYSEFNEPDYKEQHRIKSSNILKHPMPFSFHGTISPFVIDTADWEALKGLVKNIYSNAKKEFDLGASLPKQPEVMLSEIANTKIPSLRNIIFNSFYSK